MRYEYEITTDEYNDMLASVEKSVLYNEQLSRLYASMAFALKSYNGKVINANIEKAAQLPGYRVTYSKKYGRPQLYITTGGVGYDIILTNSQEDRPRLDTNYLMRRSAELKEKCVADRQACEGICEAVNKYNHALTCFKAAAKELSNTPYFYNWSRR